ncbi:regulator of chromosome condensation 1/beta-lactamase-inhibitor protein II [Xylariomycetidae sp. FL0641]|nr:regulator of chromosome condensation 1/beta-lactamase-inhibitor protein II [Xylariomycetidae sp. FL0641]
MDLYAAGLNAWRQLEFNAPEDLEDEPADISSFRSVLSGPSIESVYASLSYTIVRSSGCLQYAGFVDGTLRTSGIAENSLASRAATAGNGGIVEYDGNGALRQYSSFASYAHQKEPRSFNGIGHVVQIAAYETGFAALLESGSVLTWGDERYIACLGREPSMTSPADVPGVVEGLLDLPSGKITKVAAGGYTLLALTEGNDLYAWGGHPGRPAILEDLSRNPMPVVVEENDIRDCAAGEAHIVVLTTEGEVYVIGGNSNGQLGLPVATTGSWSKVPPLSGTAHSIIGVHAGQRSSFAIAQRHNT